MTWTLTAAGHDASQDPDALRAFAAAAFSQLDAIGATSGTFSGSAGDGQPVELTLEQARELPADDGQPSQPDPAAPTGDEPAADQLADGQDGGAVTETDNSPATVAPAGEPEGPAAGDTPDAQG